MPPVVLHNVLGSAGMGAFGLEFGMQSDKVTFASFNLVDNIGVANYEDLVGIVRLLEDSGPVGVFDVAVLNIPDFKC